MIQTSFNLIATAIVLLLAVTWNKSTPADTILKFVLISISIFGILVCLQDLGYMIKI